MLLRGTTWLQPRYSLLLLFKYIVICLLQPLLCQCNTLQLLAKEVVRLRTAVARLAANKATMLSLSNEMTQTLAISNAAGTIKSSTGVMAKMNCLIKIPQLQKTMKEMAKEMARTGYMQEMMNDAVDSAVDTDEIEEAAEEAVDQVLLEITGETLSQMASVPATKIQQQQKEEKIQQEEEEDALMARLAGLKAL